VIKIVATIQAISVLPYPMITPLQGGIVDVSFRRAIPYACDFPLSGAMHQILQIR